MLDNIKTHGLDSTRQQIAWRILVTALVLVVVEGAVRKWVIGSGFHMISYVTYFSKDILFAVLLLIPVQAKSSVAVEYFRKWLIPGCFLLLCGALASSTQEINFAGAVLTMRAAIFLPVIALLVVPRLQGVSLSLVALVIGLLVIVNFLLGVVQNQLPANHFLNRYAADTVNIVSTPTGVRATGTFSYITGLAIMSIVGLWAGIVYLNLVTDMRKQIFGWAIVASGFGCGLASISRGPILIGLVMVASWLLFFGDRSVKSPRTALAAVFFLGILILFNLTGTFSALGEGLLLRIETSEDTTPERTLGQFGEALVAFHMAPFGNGLGSEQVGRFKYDEAVMEFGHFETQLPRLILETGVLGLAGFLLICTGAILALQVAKRKIKTAGEKAALVATQFLLLSMFFTNIVFNHVASAFAWMIFAVVMAVSIQDTNRI